MKRILIENLESHIGEEVLLKGWIQNFRKVSNKMAFLILRERTGMTQIIIREPELLENYNIESVVEITGLVKREEQSRYNKIEIVASSIKVISEGQTELPITINKAQEVPFSTLINFNGLTLRTKERSAIFKIEAEIINAFREFMRSEQFTEIHSTKLVNEGLEGGGEMFEVNYFGEKAFLSQSPQFYKQMMVGVFERVFEVGKVYRAEGSNSNRHLSEYIGLDLEMGFINSVEEIMEMEEKMLNFVFNKLAINCKKELEIFNVEISEMVSIPRITFEEAIAKIENKFGEQSTTEGLTNQMEIQISEIIKEETGSEFVFVTKYPLNKRPFYTMPSEEQGCSESFELIYRGMEITTGWSKDS